MSQDVSERNRMLRDTSDCTRMLDGLAGDAPGCTRMGLNAPGCAKPHQNAPDATRFSKREQNLRDRAMLPQKPPGHTRASWDGLRRCSGQNRSPWPIQATRKGLRLVYTGDLFSLPDNLEGPGGARPSLDDLPGPRPKTSPDQPARARLDSSGRRAGASPHWPQPPSRAQGSSED